LEKEIEMNKLITAQLQQAKDAADKAAAAKSNFLSAMSHELRTPLIGKSSQSCQQQKSKKSNKNDNKANKLHSDHQE
jgi:signal transduction histidine kinase